MATADTSPNPPSHSPPAATQSPSAPASHPLITPVNLAIHALPPDLVGFRILVLADLHVRSARPFHDRIIDAVAASPCDLLALLGDYQHDVGHEAPAAHLLGRIVRASQPRCGRIGVWGNHDTPALRARLAHLPITWLANAAHPLPTVPLTLLGLDCHKYERQRPRADFLAACCDVPPYFDPTPDSPRCTVLLSHLPTWLPQAADLDIDLVLAGHTHGGQLRLPPKFALRNNTPNWPLAWSAGHLQLARTHQLTTRGLGEGARDGLRLFCPPQILSVTLLAAHDVPQPTTVQMHTKW